MKHSIAIIGANLKGNLGDFAILHAILADIRNAYPASSVDVYSQGFLPVDETRLEAFRGASGLDFTLAGQTFASKPRFKFLANFAKTLGVWPVFQARMIHSLALRNASRGAAFSRYDAIFVAGGAQWSGMEVGISMFGTLEAIHPHNNNIHVYPFSIEAKVTRFNAIERLRNYFSFIQQPLLVRDSLSKAVLDEIGVASVSCADSVYALGSEAAHIPPMTGRDPRRVILCMTGASQHELSAMAERARQAGLTACLLTTCWREDESVARRVADTLSLDYIAPVTWQDLVAEFKASSLLVTNRLHALIFGCLAKAVVLPVANRQKTKAFVGDAKAPFAATSAEAVTGPLMCACIENGPEILAAAGRYVESMAAVAESPTTRAGIALS